MCGTLGRCRFVSDYIHGEVLIFKDLDFYIFKYLDFYIFKDLDFYIFKDLLFCISNIVHSVQYRYFLRVDVY